MANENNMTEAEINKAWAIEEIKMGNLISKIEKNQEPMGVMELMLGALPATITTVATGKTKEVRAGGMRLSIRVIEALKTFGAMIDPRMIEELKRLAKEHDLEEPPVDEMAKKESAGVFDNVKFSDLAKACKSDDLPNN